MNNKKTVGVGIAALIIGVVIGAGSMHFLTPSSTTSSGRFARSGSGFGSGARPGGTSFAGGGMLAGTVTSVNAHSVVLNTRDGSSHIVLITPNTTVSKSVAGSLTDVTKGSTVIVSGTTNSDGSVSANLIQIRPANNTNNQSGTTTP